jgi:hypothetical protein
MLDWEPDTAGRDETMESCTKHPHEKGAGLCQRCGMAWCSDCLVPVFGPKKPPMCVECAMYAGGVRSAAVRPAMPKRELKARLKAAKAQAKAAADGEAAPEEAPVGVAVAEEPATDWETPWWEDREPSYVE